jgi:hypothetical protein
MWNEVGHKPYYQFVTKSDDIPLLYNKTNLIKNLNKNKKSSSVDENFDIEIYEKIQAIFSDKKNIKLLSSIFCYFLMTIDKKHHHFISNIEKYLKKHKNIIVPPSSEIPIIFDNVVGVVLKTIQENMLKNYDIQKEIHKTVDIVLNDFIIQTDNLRMHKTSFKKQYPNILRLARDTFAPLVKKHNILEKLIIILNETSENALQSFLQNNTNIKSTSYFHDLRNSIYNDENIKTAIGYNLYIFLSKKTTKVSYIRYFNNILTQNKHDIHSILDCVSENPNFVKRLLKQALFKIAPTNEHNEIISSASTLDKIINISTNKTKKIARKCRTIVNNIFVIAKMGKSVYNIGNKIEKTFPGIAKSLFF